MMFLDKSDVPFEDVIVLNRQDAAEFNASNILPQPEDLVASIQSWLKPTEYTTDGSEYRKHSSSHLNGTGQWAIDSSVFREWRDSQDHGILWIRGIPGAGKSVLAATLIEHLSHMGVPVLYFFFRHTIEANHRPEAALRDWLSQILEFSPPLQLELKDKIDTPVGDLTPPDLCQILQSALIHIPTAYCVVDAMDEMDQTALEPFLQILNELGHWRPGEIKLIITSRPVAIVERIVRNLSLLDVRLDRQLVEPDIVVYLWHRLGQSLIPSESHSIVVHYILNKADGLFLYVKLAMDAISHLSDNAEVQEALHGLPVDLSVMYANLLQEHLKRTGIAPELQILVLQCVTHAVRPLRLLEISDCITVSQPQDGQDIGKLKSLVRSVCGPLLEILPDETVRVVHHSLTEYLLDTTRATRDAAAPFIVLEPGFTHCRMALLCLSYLQSCGMDQVKIRKRGHFVPTPEQLTSEIYTPFTNYAVRNWHAHIKKAAIWGHDLHEINESLHELLVQGDPESTNKLSLFAGLESSVRRRSSGQQSKAQTAALRLAIALNLNSFTESLLDRYGKEIANYDADIDYSPLVSAVAGGNSSIVQSLICHGADVNEHDSCGATPLHTALGYRKSWQGNVEMAEILLKAGADPLIDFGENKHVYNNRMGGRDWCPASMYAFASGDRRMAAVFLPYVKGAREASRALAWAVSSSVAQSFPLLGGITRSLDVAAEVLRHPELDINAKDGHIRTRVYPVTPLYLACALRHAALIRLLLAAGADPNVPHGGGTWETWKTWEPSGTAQVDGVGRNVLHALADGSGFSEYRTLQVSEEETKECFRMAVEAGANLQQVDDKKTTPLHAAGDKVAARCLIEAGADINAENADGETPLHLIHDVEILEALHDLFDMNAKSSSQGQTLLIHALAERNCNWTDPNSKQHPLDKALKLCELGADVTLVDSTGKSALHYAAEMQRVEDVKLLWQKLIAAGADQNLQDKEGQTPAHRIGFNGLQSRIKESHLAAFLEITKPDLEIKDERGQTPLFKIVDTRKYFDTTEAVKGFRLLAKAGARFDTTDLRGRTLLHAAARHGSSDTRHMRFIVDQGADPTQPDFEGNTIWHEAIPRFSGGRATAMAFTALGADLSRANSHGKTPLHVLCEFMESPIEEGSLGLQDDPGLFGYILDQDRAQLNLADNQGVTPLHIASTYSPSLTHRLLAEGADVAATTSDGLNAFHLAARSRQSNTIGLLISWLQPKCDRKSLLKVIEAKDARGRTPLYYACASGRVETAQLLIDAGALVDTDEYIGSAWNGCADFEEEQKNADWWYRWNSASLGSREESPAGGVLISDKLRPRRQQSSPSNYLRQIFFPFERIDEILLLLLANGETSGRTFLDEAISSAVERQLDYTTVCLVGARQSLDITEPLNCEGEVLECIKRRDAASLSHPRGDGWRFQDLMSMRDFDAASKSLLEEDGADIYGEKSRNGKDYLEELVQGGFASILGSVLTPKVISKLRSVPKPEITGRHANNKKEVAKKDQASVASNQKLIKLLLMACQTEIPNMNILRVLIERKGVSVSSSLDDSYNHYRHYSDPHNRTALHVIVEEGRPYYWWQTHQALPYLLSNGANLEARDSDGMTPLLLCLEKIGKPGFSKETTMIFLRAGADPNAVDKYGRSCLAYAVKDRAVCETLLEYGAVITPSALISAIRSKDLDILQLMLCRPGVDPNMRKPGKEIPLRISPDGMSHSPAKHDPNCSDEFYPIDYVVCEPDMRKSFDISQRMFDLLLKHGADLNARYECTTIVHRLVSNMKNLRSTSYDGENPYLLRILEHPNLDLESRDRNGLTILLLACQCGKMQVIKTLLDRGADIRARDNRNRNVLHLFLLNREPRKRPANFPVRGHADGLVLGKELIQRLVPLAPELLAEVDVDGRTPLHCSLQSDYPRHPSFDSLIGEEADALISAGADVCAPILQTGDTPLHQLLGGEWHIDIDENGVGVVNGKRKDLLHRFLSLGADINARNANGETPAFHYFRKGSVTVTFPETDDDRAQAQSVTIIWPEPEPYDDTAFQLSRPPNRRCEQKRLRRERDGAATVEQESQVWALFDQVGMDWLVTSTPGESLLHVVAADVTNEEEKYRYWPGRRLARFRFLMSKGIDVLAEDQKHRTALDIAAAVGVEDILEMFKRKG